MNVIDRVPFNKLFVRNSNGYSPIRKIIASGSTYFVNHVKCPGHFIIDYATGLVEDYTTAIWLLRTNEFGIAVLVGFDSSTVSKHYRNVEPGRING